MFTQIPHTPPHGHVMQGDAFFLCELTVCTNNSDNMDKYVLSCHWLDNQQ